MNNKEFKDKIIGEGVKLLGLLSKHDLVINKKLEINIRMRKKPNLPNLKPGEVVVIKAIDLKDYAESIARESIETVLAIYDLQERENKEEKIKEFDEQIKHQIILTKYHIVVELVKAITPAKQIQIYNSLGIKNAEYTVNNCNNNNI